MRSLLFTSRKGFFLLFFFLIVNANQCGLVLTGTDAGKEFLGISQKDKKDPSETVAELLSVLGSNVGLLVFSPPVLTMSQFQYQSYNASIKTPIPSGWDGSSDSVLEVNLTTFGCPPPSDDNSTMLFFSGGQSYTMQSATFRFLATGSCSILHVVNLSSSDMGLAPGTLIGILPVQITP